MKISILWQMEMEAGKYKITPRPSMGCQIKSDQGNPNCIFELTQQLARIKLRVQFLYLYFDSKRATVLSGASTINRRR